MSRIPLSSLPRAVRQIEHCWIPMSDGVRLAARIWMPEDADRQPVPAILEYTPYRKRDLVAERDETIHPYFAGHGYAAVRIDIRGSGDSEGLLLGEYLAQDHDDAVEAIAWIAVQAWCDGNVGMMGLSWGGFEALQVAARRPPQLKAIISLGSVADRYADDMHFKGGCLLNDNMYWHPLFFSLLSRPPDPMIVGDVWRDMWFERLENLINPIQEWLPHQRRDAFWKHGSVCEDYAAIEAAVYAVGGWADAYSNAIPRLIEGLPGPVKGLTGPWMHKYPHFAAPAPRIGFLQECLRWWDHWLKGLDTGIMDEPIYRAFMQESVPPKAMYEARDGRWIAEPEWPSPNIETSAFALSAAGLTQGPAPAQTLMLRSPENTGTAGGEFCAMWLGPDMPVDQRVDDAGSLVFDAPPLDQRVEIFGAPEVVLDLAADRPQANIAVRLCDVDPTGASTRVTIGILNLSHRESHEMPSLLTPGERYRVRVKLNDIAHAFPPGNRIRLAVSTAYWPLIWPSPEPVTLTLHTGESRLDLPIRPPRDEALTPFEESETAPPQRYEELRPEAKSRTVERDLATGETVVRIVNDFGEQRILDHDLATGEISRVTHRILADDPTSARTETHWTETLGRGDWRVRCESRTTMWSDRENFHIEAKLEAFEGDERVFERDWTHSVRRNMV